MNRFLIAIFAVVAILAITAIVNFTNMNRRIGDLEAKLAHTNLWADGAVREQDNRMWRDKVEARLLQVDTDMRFVGSWKLSMGDQFETAFGRITAAENNIKLLMFAHNDNATGVWFVRGGKLSHMPRSLDLNDEDRKFLAGKVVPE